MSHHLLRGVISYLILLISFNTYCQDNYEVGVGIYDITGQIAQSNFFGYAKPGHRNKGIRDRQYARAYIIQEPNKDPVVFVCIDKAATFQAVNIEVMKKLNAKFGSLYNDNNVVISATHTHVAAGGFSHYSLYNTATGGYWKANFDNAVEGIFQSIVRAHNNIAPGSIYLNRGSLVNASINRSIEAYNNNSDARRFSPIDHEMTVLKLTQSGKEVGMISWFGVHPTSLSGDYRHNSADSKGYAALKFERLKSSSYGQNGSFVAAFANSNAGDMSPNLNMPTMRDHKTNATGPGSNEEESCDIIGQRQYDKALRLYTTATTKLTGPVKAVSRYTDYSKVTVDGKFTDGTPHTTCKAALGFSFMAGAEDGRSGFGFKEGKTKQRSGKTSDRACHCEKPIAPFFFVGRNENDPKTPKILPTSILKIGQFGILAVPAEFTVMSGRRVRKTVESIAQAGITETVLAGYSDAYAGYVTTREEYAMQHYEGASTHFGPWTLGAYRQEFDKLASLIVDSSLQLWSVPEPSVPIKQEPKYKNTNYSQDRKPSGKNFGDIKSGTNTIYVVGDIVEVEFWGAHPNNDLRVNQTYLEIQKKDGNWWTTVYTDRDPDTKLSWKRIGLHKSEINIKWTIDNDVESGFYRIMHYGKSKEVGGRLTPYTAVSSQFYVGARNFISKSENSASVSDDELEATSRIEISNSLNNIELTNEISSNGVKLYPNPNSGEFNIEFPSNLVGTYQILNIYGKILSASRIPENHFEQIDFDGPAGVYLLIAFGTDGEKHTVKFVKQ